MDVKTTSFLIKCDVNLNILGTYWYYPAHLISPYQKSLKDLFVASDIDKLRSLVSKVLSQQNILECNSFFTIINLDIEVSLCVLAIKDKVIIHGIESKILKNQKIATIFRGTIHRFMRTIKVSDNDLIDDNNVIIREQFEQIQRLNNDLLNTQRQLKKANAKLNLMNSELNNRLVKDALTGLISRYQYREEIKLTIAKAPEKLGIFTFIDLDDFKTINDTYGHGNGDIFLIEFANRLKKLPFDNQVCIRIAGDEFGLYIHGYDTVTEVHIKAIWDSTASRVINTPIIINNVAENIKCSLGMAIYGIDTDDVYQLIEYADFAMYEAKSTGKNSYKQFDRKRYDQKKS